MSFALNEIEAMARKATRGAGYSWGMAEEAAKATRWLCGQGQDGCGALAQVLCVTDGKPLGDIRPANTTDPANPANLTVPWRAVSGQLCPLLTGAALADFAFLMAQGDIQMENVVQPVLLLPFLAIAACAHGANLTAEIDGTKVVTDGHVLGWTSAINADLGRHIIVHRGGVLPPALGTTSRAAPQAEIWTLLSDFAARTSAPASAASREMGAGDGTGLDKWD